MISILIGTAVAIVLLIVIFLMGYVKASPDTAYIISGLRKKPKILIGRAGVQIPFLEKRDRLMLSLLAIDVKTASAVPTADYINIRVDANVNVKVSSQPELLARAAQNFLNKDGDYIRSVAREVLEGNMREIVGQMRLQEMVSDRQKFAEMVKGNASPDLAAMGLEIVSFNVQNFVDDNEVIENLGVDNIVQIQKNAAISRAESEKEIAVARAKANKESNDAEVAAQAEIAAKQNDLIIRKADLKRESDGKRAQADAAYEIETQNQRRTIEITTAEANIAKQEKEIIIKQREAEVAEESLNATVKKQADADLYRRQRDAEARKFEAQRAAEALLFEKQQQAAGILAVGRAEAEAIQQKGLAEAAAMEKKALAYQKYNHAAVAEAIIKVLPEIAARIAEPLAAIDNLTIIGGSGDSGVSSVADGVPTVMAKMMETVKATTGIDLGEIIKADTYDAKVTRNLNVTVEGSEDTDPVTTAAVVKELVEEAAAEEKPEE